MCWFEMIRNLRLLSWVREGKAEIQSAFNFDIIETSFHLSVYFTWEVLNWTSETIFLLQNMFEPIRVHWTTTFEMSFSGS